MAVALERQSKDYPRTGGDLFVPQSELPIPLYSPDIFVHGTGVDLPYPYPDGSRPRHYRYEDKAFRGVASDSLPRVLDVGPCALEKFFRPRLKTSSRFDAARFLKTSDGKLVLIQGFEFRSGKLELFKKIAVLASFTDEARDEDLFTEMFDLYFGDYLESNFPEYEPSVIVPPTGDITLTFVDPIKRENTSLEHTSFRRVDFRRVT